jgi:hypothetical protein
LLPPKEPFSTSAFQASPMMIDNEINFLINHEGHEEHEEITFPQPSEQA